MAFTQTAHSLDPAKPGASLMSVDNTRYKRTIVPISRADVTPAYNPQILFTGGAYGDDVDTATANVAYNATMAESPAYAPKTQAEKATQLGTTLAKDVGTPRGWIEPSEPYGPAPVSPTDDPTIASLAPNTAATGGNPIWVTITGTKFTVWSTVETGGVYTPYSRYISPTKMAVLMDPRSSAGSVDVKVLDHGVKSNASAFTFT